MSFAILFIDHEVFLARHRAIFPGAKTPKDLCTRLQTMFQFSDMDFQIGRTKVFLQHGLSDKLESMAHIRYKVAVRKIQTIAKSWVQYKLVLKIQTMYRRAKEQKKYQHMKQGMIQLQAVIRGGATRQNVEQIRSAKKLQMLAVVNAVMVLQKYFKKFSKKIKRNKKNIENIEKKHQKEINGMSESLKKMKQENDALKELLKKHAIEPP